MAFYSSFTELLIGIHRGIFMYDTEFIRMNLILEHV